MTVKRSPWTGIVLVNDTALAVTDTDTDGVPVIYLNGHAAVQRQWRRVLAELGTEWRRITYDMRGRGRSKRSADSSFETNIRDVDAVLAARGVARAVVVGWSYGAFVAAHWASRHPARTVGAVFVEGARPHDWFEESMEPGDAQAMDPDLVAHATAAPGRHGPTNDRRPAGREQHRGRQDRPRA